MTIDSRGTSRPRLDAQGHGLPGIVSSNQHLRAHKADELHRLLPEPEFRDALGVLEMITRTPDTRDLYDARLKAKLDAEARLEYVR
jgi:hypothetical protein